MACQQDDALTLIEPGGSTIAPSTVAASAVSEPALPAADPIPPAHPAGRVGWRLASWLGVCFAMPIVLMIGAGYWASDRVLSVDHSVDLKIESRLAKLGMIHQAVRLSNENNSITTRLFLDKNAVARGKEVSARREENSGHLTEIVAKLVAQSDSDKERQLLQTIRETRAPYLRDYRYALHVLLEERDPAKAEALLVGRVMPELYTYHLAWNDLTSFEMEQITVAHEQGETLDRTTRHVALTIVWLAALFASGMGAFATSRIVADTKARALMQQELSTLNAMLERRVTQRTQELARAQDQLRDSLSQTQAYTREVEAINELVKLLQSCLTHGRGAQAGRAGSAAVFRRRIGVTAQLLSQPAGRRFHLGIRGEQNRPLPAGKLLGAARRRAPPGAAARTQPALRTYRRQPGGLPFVSSDDRARGLAGSVEH